MRVTCPSKDISALYTVLAKIESERDDNNNNNINNINNNNSKGSAEEGGEGKGGGGGHIGEVTKLSEEYSGEAGDVYIAHLRVPLEVCEQFEGTLYSLTKGQSTCTIVDDDDDTEIEL